MTIDEAILILARMGTPESKSSPEDNLAARQLGIEAMEQIMRLRLVKGGGWAHRLPGETDVINKEEVSHATIR
jgi:hypothetical protein